MISLSQTAHLVVSILIREEIEGLILQAVALLHIIISVDG